MGPGDDDSPMQDWIRYILSQSPPKPSWIFLTETFPFELTYHIPCALESRSARGSLVTSRDIGHWMVLFFFDLAVAIIAVSRFRTRVMIGCATHGVLLLSRSRSRKDPVERESSVATNLEQHPLQARLLRFATSLDFDSLSLSAYICAALCLVFGLILKSPHPQFEPTMLSPNVLSLCTSRSCRCDGDVCSCTQIWVHGLDLVV